MSGSQSQSIELDTARMSVRAWGVLLVLCTTIFLEGLDVSMMGVALPAIQSDLGMTTSSLQWIMSAMCLGTPASRCWAGGRRTSLAGAGCF